MKVESESETAQSCPTLSDLMDCSLPGSSAHGIFQASVLEWGAIAVSNYMPIIKKKKKKLIVPDHQVPKPGAPAASPLLGKGLSHPSIIELTLEETALWP